MSDPNPTEKWIIICRSRQNWRKIWLLDERETLANALSICECRNTEYPDEICATLRMPVLEEIMAALIPPGTNGGRDRDDDEAAPTKADARRMRLLWADLFGLRSPAYMNVTAEHDGSGCRDDRDRDR